MKHFFDRVLTFGETRQKKPSPVRFRMALDAPGTRPEETLMVGDRAERDIAGAKALGIKTAWAGYGDEFHTKESGADYELDDILELLDVVRRENQNQPGLFDRPEARTA